jgi:hypothetical protein
MEQVIVWTVILGTGVFGIGLISAISSRRRRHRDPVIGVRATGNVKTIPTEIGGNLAGEMNNAASGTGQWAAHSDEGVLAGAGQGREH